MRADAGLSVGGALRRRFPTTHFAIHGTEHLHTLCGQSTEAAGEEALRQACADKEGYYPCPHWRLRDRYLPGCHHPRVPGVPARPFPRRPGANGGRLSPSPSMRGVSSLVPAAVGDAPRDHGLQRPRPSGDAVERPARPGGLAGPPRPVLVRRHVARGARHIPHHLVPRSYLLDLAWAAEGGRSLLPRAQVLERFVTAIGDEDGQFNASTEEPDRLCSLSRDTAVERASAVEEPTGRQPYQHHPLIRMTGPRSMTPSQLLPPTRPGQLIGCKDVPFRLTYIESVLSKRLQSPSHVSLR